VKRSESSGNEVPFTSGPETASSQQGEAENPTRQREGKIMEKLLLSPEEVAEVIGCRSIACMT
jgi:hypothetical protein